MCVCREDEAWLDIKLHCTSKDAFPRTDTAKALDCIPHLPGAADSKPSAPRVLPTNPDAVSLSDVTYDSSRGCSSWTSASAFFVQPG